MEFEGSVMVKVKKNILIILGAFLFLLSAAIFAAPIGTVISSYGKVYAQNQAGNRITLKRNSPVFLNDLIVTEEGGQVQVRFNDDSYIFLKQLSQYKVSEFKFNKENPRDNRYTGNIVKGALISLSGQGKPNNYQYNTPLAIIGVRGTGFAYKTGEADDLLVFRGFVLVKTVKAKGIPPHLFRSQSMLVGIGQKLNAVSINRNGRITKLAGLLSFLPQELKTHPVNVSHGVITPTAVSNVFSNPITAPFQGPPPMPGVPGG